MAVGQVSLHLLSRSLRTIAGIGYRIGCGRVTCRSLAQKAPSNTPDSTEHPGGIPLNELTSSLGFSYYTINRKLDGSTDALPAIFVKHPANTQESTETDEKKRDPLLDGRGSGWFAVIAKGPKQYKVTVGDTVYLDRLDGQVYDEIRFPQVLALGSVDWSVIGRPYIPGAEAIAVIEEQSLAQKIHIYHKKRRKGYERLRGHRQPYTRIHITDIRWQVPEDSELEPLLIDRDL